MGAAMALTVTATRPDLVAGCIALEAPFRAPGRRSELLADARIANGWHNPAYVRALLSPTAPERFRDEACAVYAQARPGVYMGDLAYYSDEYDGSRFAALLRDCGRPIALLTGSYDYSASPENTRQLASAIGGSSVLFEEMTGLGHFPMIEHPAAFRPHFIAALDFVSGGKR
jgi:pimeloyl-ACP methyl ester carboxylesterase